jgi:hypothetical protein
MTGDFVVMKVSASTFVVMLALISIQKEDPIFLSYRCALSLTIGLPLGLADGNQKMTDQHFTATISSISKGISNRPAASVLSTKPDFRLLSDDFPE